MLTAETHKKLGERGFRAPWIKVICPTLLPEGIIAVLEDSFGNKTAHEITLLVAAANQRTSMEIVRTQEVCFPGRLGSPAPGFSRIRRTVVPLLRFGPGYVKRNVEKLIEAYLRLLEQEPEPEPGHS